MKKNKTEKKTYTVYLTYDEVRSGGEAVNPTEEFSEREPEYIDFTPNCFYYFHLSKQHFLDKLIQYRDYELDFNPHNITEVFAVVVRYQDGDTFGSSHGNWEIPEIHKTQAKAEQIKGQIEAATGKYGEKKYHPWTGYFSSLEGVYVMKLKLKHHI